LCGIRIELVPSAAVVSRREFHLGPLRHTLWLHRRVDSLPVEVVSRHFQHHLLAPIGIMQLHHIGLASKMHVDVIEANDCVVVERLARGQRVARRSRWDLYGPSIAKQPLYVLPHHAAGKKETARALTPALLVRRRVVDLDPETHSFWNSNRRAFRQHHRLNAGSPTRYHHRSTCGGIKVSGDVAFGRNRHARRNYVSVGVVNRLQVSRTRINTSYPRVFGKNVVKYKEDVLILLARLDRVGLSDLDYQIGLAVSPFVFPDSRRRQVLRITSRRACVDPFYDCGDLLIGKPRVVDVSPDHTRGV